MTVFDEIKNGINVIRRNITLINEMKIQSNREANPENFKSLCLKIIFDYRSIDEKVRYSYE